MKSVRAFGSKSHRETRTKEHLLEDLGAISVKKMMKRIYDEHICLGIDLEPDEWIKDNGCSKHMTGNQKLFSTTKASMSNIFLGIDLEPDECIKDSGCSKHMTGNRKLFSTYKAYNGEVSGRKALYMMKLGNKPKDKICLATIDENSTLWHRRLGHANMRLIQSLASKELVRNLPKLRFDQHFCDACKIGKQAHVSHKAKNIVSTTRCLELLHMDIISSSTVWSYGGNCYTLVIVDDYSRLVAQDYNQQEGIDYDETYALVARLESIRILLACACALDFKLFQMDVKSSFLNGFINEEFEMSMMGELNFFLGLQIKQMEDGIFFNQSKYIKEMLKKFGLEDFKPMKTPMSSDTKLTKDEECESVDSTKYRGMIGTMHLGLWYPKGTDIKTVVYANSDHAGDYVDRKSTSGIYTFVGCCLTSWFSKKQTALAISTTEAEYVSAGKACQQALWMKQALIDYDVTMPRKSFEEYKNTRYYILKISHEFCSPIKEKLRNLEECYIHEGQVVFDNFTDLNYVRSLFHFVEFECLLEINEQVCPHFILEFYSQYRLSYSDEGKMFVEFFFQNQYFSLSLEDFVQILRITCEGACVLSDRWSLDKLVYGAPSEGPYQTNLPSPDDIISYVREDREGQVTRIRHQEEIEVQDYQILTREIVSTLKPLEEIIRENVFCLGGNRANVPVCLCYMLYCVANSERFNLAYFMAKRMEWVIKQARLILPYERKPRRDRGTRRGRHSPSSSSAFDQPSSSHLNDDDDDGNDEGTSRASTPSPIRYVNSLTNQVPQVFQNPSNVDQNMEPLYTRQTEILNREVQLRDEHRVTTTPSPTTTSSSLTPLNAPSKTPSINQTSSSQDNTSSSFQSKLQISPPSSNEPTSPQPLNPLLKNILDVPPRPLNPQPLQSHPSLDITLSLSLITPLDHIHDTPSPPSSPQPQPPIMGHPLFYNYHDYHGLTCICCFHNRNLHLNLRDEMNIMFAHLEYLLTTALTTHFPPLP
ncbi:pentatricopeptide repeat-containing protein [Tanacetum coccineum]